MATAGFRSSDRVRRALQAALYHARRQRLERQRAAETPEEPEDPPEEGTPPEDEE